MFPDDYPINDRWPAERPDVIQLYSYPTPNGQKVSTMLEETGLDYEPHLVTLKDEDVKSQAFLSLNPNNKIPALIDPNGPEGPVALFESGAILIYLAEKTGKLLPASGQARADVMKWLMWQMGGLGPMLGQLGFFYKFAPKDLTDPRPKERYINEARRLFGVLDGALDGRDWVAGDYSIADIAIVPWVRAIDFYGAQEAIGMDAFPNVAAYRARFEERPAYKTGQKIPAVPES